MTNRPLVLFLLAAAGLATLYRLAPIALGEDAMARFFITEDGYLMLTIARNLAIGAGMSVSDGTIATNGVQPLATFLFALPYLAAGGDKAASLVGVIALMAAWSVGGFFAIRAFATEVLRAHDDDPAWPLLVAVLWFVGPLALAHSMNGLETGLYVMIVAITVTVFGRLMAKDAPYAARDQVLFGALCGLTFLARIDGAFLVTAMFLVRFVQVQASGRLDFVGAVKEALPPGLISLAFAAPWLLYNQLCFGSIMPTSGTAQSASTPFGVNLHTIAPNLFETMLPMLPIPQALEPTAPVQAVTAAVVIAVLGVFLYRTLRRRDPFRFAILAYALYGVAIVSYYGLVFGAGHFVNRYFAPLAPLLVTAAIAVGLDVFRALGPWGRRAPAVGGALAVALCLALLARLAAPGVKEQGHFQVVEWVRANVPQETWVGAVQTGTLGYWHDRTVNLDGKVNPHALRERLERGHVLGYVVASDIEYIVDWASVGRTWSGRGDAAFDATFSLILIDPRNNLSVMRRTS
jgi:hypothetical protein